MPELDRPRVLVVEGDADVRRSFGRTLEGSYQVFGAASGEEAMRFLQGPERLPDLVMLDVDLPGLDGYDLCAWIQEREDLQWIPVVFVTVLETDEDRRRAFAAGAADCLSKPVERDELVKTVAEHVDTGTRWSSLRQSPSRQRSWLLPSTFVAFKRYMLEQTSAGPSQRKEAEALGPADAYELARVLRIPEEQIARYLARFLDLPYHERFNSDEIALGALPRTFCASNLVVPLKDRTVVVANPFDWELMDVLERTFWRRSTAALALTAPHRIRELCEDGRVDVVDEAAAVERTVTLDPGGAAAGDDGAETEALANEILRGAVADRASDVHVEPKERGALVRYRIDGDMHDIRTLPGTQSARLISRLKALAGMDIAERRKPQDGALAVSMGDRRLKLRLATSSTGLGETLVVRILEPDLDPVPLEELGFAATQAEELRAMTDRSQGLILVVGPTGSGKSTTIFTLLSTVDGRSRSIMSVEDPVEYRIAYANQQQVNERAGVTFETLLRSAMRQDPDILFLGEVRDTFSARAAMDFASSGHLTISTLHSSNSTTAVFRLERLGVERGAMADAVSCVVAQKLLKTLCPECREVGSPDDREEALLADFTDEIPDSVARPVGCPACRETGYFGREVASEMLPFDSEVAALVRDGRSISEIRSFCADRGDYLIARHAIDKVRDLRFSVRDVYEQVLVEDGTLGSRRKSRPAPAGGGAAAAREIRSQEDPAEAGAPGTGDPEPPPSLRAPGQEPLVLVVDDDPDIRALVELHLSRAGYAVVCAADGVEALLELGSRDIDVVLSDVNMPNLDGVKLMEMIGQKGVDVPAIFLTGTEDEAVEARLLSIGAADYIRKPVRKEVLLMRLRNAVRGRSPAGGGDA